MAGHADARRLLRRLGLGPTLVIPVLGAVAASVLGEAPPTTVGDWLTLRVAVGYASLSTLAIAIALGAALLVPLVASRWSGRRAGRAPTRRGPHRPDFADGVHGHCVREPFQARLRLLLSADEAPGHRVPPGVALLRRAHRIPEPGALDLPRLALPARARPPSRRARAAGALQSGSANLYLAYILAALLLMLVLA